LAIDWASFPFDSGNNPPALGFDSVSLAYKPGTSLVNPLKALARFCSGRIVVGSRNANLLRGWRMQLPFWPSRGQRPWAWLQIDKTTSLKVGKAKRRRCADQQEITTSLPASPETALPFGTTCSPKRKSSFKKNELLSIWVLSEDPS